MRYFYVLNSLNMSQGKHAHSFFYRAGADPGIIPATVNDFFTDDELFF
ncbi:MAG: hypothetical protein JXB88_10310 [Spirochaetales bacterium]|nr:hypothetical protein [Spirochaetales bacterium]